MDVRIWEALKPTLIAYQTLLLFVMFLVLVWWAYSMRRKDTFDAVANSIFEEDVVSAASPETEQDRAGANKQ